MHCASLTLLGMKKIQIDQLLSIAETDIEREQIFESAFESLSKVDRNKCVSLKAYLNRLAISAVDYSVWLNEIIEMSEGGMKCDIESLYLFLGPTRVTEFIKVLALNYSSIH